MPILKGCGHYLVQPFFQVRVKETEQPLTIISTLIFPVVYQ